MALLAVGREVRSHVTGRLRTGERSHVATDAIGGESLELSDCRASMTGLAFRDRVRSDQRKAVLVLVDRLERNHPSVHAVALFALRPHLAAMEVGVAVGALVAHIGEHGFGVAFHAGHVLVQAAQRITGLAVIELGHAADGLPAGKRVAVLARNVERTVGTARRLRHTRLLRWRTAKRSQQQQNKLDC